MLEIQPTDPAGVYFDEAGRVALTPNRLASHQAMAIPDDLAISSVLQFGAVVPPLSPWQGIRRFMPGYRYDGVNPLGPVGGSSMARSGSSRTPNSMSLSIAIENAVDESIRRTVGDGPHPVLLFSGGVDSGFIASRLVACGYNRSLLLNFSFGDSDPESDLAEAMATELGLPFERIYGKNDGDLDLVLRSPGMIYPQPFGDRSALPTGQLAHAAIDRLAGEHRLILDGTGADGAFGLSGKIRKWQQVSRMPRLAGYGASAVYSSGRLWLSVGKVEHALRILRRVATVPDAAGVIAQNPLAGVLYDAGGSNSTMAGRLLLDWVDSWSGESFERRVVGADLALTCANVFVSKSRPIFAAAGVKVHYPFLEPDILSLALSTAGASGGYEKTPLKQSLANVVPQAMVYRPKSGFVDPENRVFHSRAFLEYLDAAIHPSAPIADMLLQRNVRRALKKLLAGRSLPTQTLNVLWAIVFTDRWYRTALASK